MKLHLHLKLLITLLLFSPGLLFSQNTHHVYSTEIPWLNTEITKEEGRLYSITAALEQAEEGDIILIHEGIYRETITVQKNNISIQNYQDEYVLVSGTEIVTGWTEAQDMNSGIMQSDISSFNIETDYTQLFSNGEQQIMARHPNNTTGNSMEPMDANSGYAPLTNVYKEEGVGATGHITLEGTPVPDVDLTGGIARTLTGKMRQYVFGRITANSGNTVSFTAINNGEWKDAAAFSNTKHKYSWGYLLHKNLIDYPGEWFADAGTLYYMPREGENLDSTRIEIQVRERVLVLNNTTGISIKGINFVAGNADMQKTNNAVLESCSMRYLYPFWTPMGYGQGDTDKKGIYLENSSNNIFKDNYISHSWGNMIALRYGENNSFENCIIQDFGWIAVFTSGIHVNQSNNTNIKQCTFGDAGRFQVRIDGGDAKVNILDCDFYGSMKVGEDAGPIEATSTGRIGSINLKGSEIAYNRVHDVVGVPVSNGGYSRVKATAFYMEDVENYTAHHNLVYNIKHNVYDGPHEVERVGEFLYLGPRYNAMHKPVNYYNNTIWNVDENIGIWNIVIDNWAELGIAPPDTTGLIDDGHFANNIFMNGPGYKMSYNSQVLNSKGGKVDWASSPAGASISTHDFNEYTTHCAEWGYHFNPQTNVFYNAEDADLNFVDAANGDFTLQSGSSAIAAGTVLDGYTNAVAPDCGALEGGNRVLLAGSNLEAPHFEELGVSFVPETEWVKHIDLPNIFSDTTAIFTCKVAFNAFEDRDIIVSFRTPENTYVAQGRTTVTEGNDTVNVQVSAGVQPIAEDYIFMAAIRPVGGKSGSDIHSQTRHADIAIMETSVFELQNNSHLKLYPNPVSNILNIQLVESTIINAPLQIYDIKGVLVYSKTIHFNNAIAQVDIGALNRGTYILKIGTLYKSLFVKN